MTDRKALVIFNLGGPDSLSAVHPFLFNLFRDPAILELPFLARGLLAWIIATKRAPSVRRMYRKIGGRSPLVEETQRQAEALSARLNENWRVFMAMRYWKPFIEQTVQEVVLWNPKRIVLLPLYPQYSKSTTGSFCLAWQDAMSKMGKTIPITKICCYPTAEGLIAAHVDLIKGALLRAGPRARILFSAHGLPKRMIERGDPYQAQVEMTATAVALGLERDTDWVLCYQSKVGPLEWIGPSTESEIRRAGTAGLPLVVVPIAFVSEHSETLVELDMEYAEVARQAGVPAYIRVPALGTHPLFIQTLANLARAAAAGSPGWCGDGDRRPCLPARRDGCAWSAQTAIDPRQPIR